MWSAGQAAARTDTRLTPNLLEHQAVALLIDPEDGKIVDANKAAASFYGYPRERLQRMFIQDLNRLTPAEVTAEFRHARDEERNYFIFPHRLAGGEVRTVEVYSSPFVTAAGQTLLLSIIHDATDKAVIEEELQRYQNRLQGLVAQQTEELVRTASIC